MIGEGAMQQDWTNASCQSQLLASQVELLCGAGDDVFGNGDAYSTTASGDGTVPSSLGGFSTQNTGSSQASYATAVASIGNERFDSTSSDLYAKAPEVREANVETASVRDTDLNYFHCVATFDAAISAGQFVKIKGLSDCCRNDGKVELHRWESAGACHDQIVVVKRVRVERVNANKGKEANERVVHYARSYRDTEDCLAELGVYSYLRQQADLPEYILKMHTIFQADSDVWLVLENAEGGDLFNALQNGKLEEQQLKVWMFQLCQATAYLHRHSIAHRDISVENVLLCGGVVRLMDFGQAVRTHRPSGGEPLRYYAPVGKPYYTGPECYVPFETSMRVQVPAGAHPGGVALAGTPAGYLCQVLLPKDAVVGQECVADFYGYVPAANDVFACGICLFIMATGAPPWRRALLTDPHFSWVRKAGIAKLLAAWKKSLSILPMNLMESMLRMDPLQRSTMERCAVHPWFASLNGGHSDLVGDAALLQWGEGVSTTGFSGDAYCLPEASRSADGLPAGNFYNSGEGFQGDFYSGMDGPPGSLIGGALSPQLGDAPSCFIDKMGPSVSNREGSPAPISLERFAAGSSPPSLPSVPGFQLEPTTFHTAGAASEVGNLLLEFLLERRAAITKVSGKKFAIKADLEGDAGACTVKVRLYHQGGDRYAIQFQRRNGHATALHLVFRKAAEYLRQRNVRIE